MQSMGVNVHVERLQEEEYKVKDQTTCSKSSRVQFFPILFPPCVEGERQLKAPLDESFAFDYHSKYLKKLSWELVTEGHIHALSVR